MTTEVKRANDPRQRYSHQAYDVTFGGMPSEGGIAGYGTAVAATYAADFEIVAKGDGTKTAFQFSMPPHVYGAAVSVIAPHSTALSTAALVLEAVTDGPDEVTLAAALAVAAEAVETALDAAYPAENAHDTWRTLTVTFSAAIPAGEAVVMALNLHIVKSAWK